MVILAVLAGLVTAVGLLEAMSVCPVYADDTGWKAPSANAADTGGDGDGFELNPTNAYSDDVTVASNIDGPGDRHLYCGYDFGLPEGATTKGIEVRLDWYVDSAAGSPRLEVELSWDGGTSWTDAKKTKNGKTIERTHILGGPTDTWGRSWTVDELSSTNFRVRITCTSKKAERDFYLDWVPVNVYDDPPTAVNITSFTIEPGRSTAGSQGVWHFLLQAVVTVLAIGKFAWMKRRRRDLV